MTPALFRDFDPARYDEPDAARRDRDQLAAELREAGLSVRCWDLRDRAVTIYRLDVVASESAA
jgi:hypothetical protein